MLSSSSTKTPLAFYVLASQGIYKAAYKEPVNFFPSKLSRPLLVNGDDLNGLRRPENLSKVAC